MAGDKFVRYPAAVAYLAAMAAGISSTEKLRALVGLIKVPPYALRHAAVATRRMSSGCHQARLCRRFGGHLAIVLDALDGLTCGIDPPAIAVDIGHKAGFLDDGSLFQARRELAIFIAKRRRRLDGIGNVISKFTVHYAAGVLATTAAASCAARALSPSASACTRVMVAGSVVVSFSAAICCDSVLSNASTASSASLFAFALVSACASTSSSCPMISFPLCKTLNNRLRTRSNLSSIRLRLSPQKPAP